jgi:hypothetical protein
MDTETADDGWQEAEVAWSAVAEVSAELIEARRLLAPGIVGGMVALSRLIAPAAPAPAPALFARAARPAWGAEHDRAEMAIARAARRAFAA